MRDLLERSRSARVAVAIVSGCCVLALVQAAAAHNDLDMRETFRVPAQAAPVASSAPTPAFPTERRREAVITRSKARPMRVGLDRNPHQVHHIAERSTPARRVAARRPPLSIHLASRPPTAALPPSRDDLFAPIEQRPAIVSIYEDQTLRRGDAVMMRDGLQVFDGREMGAHRPADFVRLARAQSLDWHLRKTLSAFENNPPDHWRS